MTEETTEQIIVQDNGVDSSSSSSDDCWALTDNLLLAFHSLSSLARIGFACSKK
jgi:hypothetical protein